MKKLIPIALVLGTLAATAGAQMPAPQAAGGSGGGTDSAGPLTPADVRAADLNRLTDIRGWQAGPSAGDAAARVDASTPMAPDARRAADLKSLTEIRGWQAGPSAGDAAAASAQKAAPAVTAPRLDTAGAEQALSQEATP